MDKYCSACTQTLPIEKFGRYSRAPDGRKHHCKDCIKAARRRRREEGKVTPGAEERFWSRVEKTDTCWLWRGGITTEGYGRFFHAGKDVPSHHMPIIFDGGEPPRYPMVCDHLCKVRHCVRPDHIRVVTQTINTLENSNSWWAKNKAKECCPQGHPYSDENVAIVQRKHGGDRSGVGRICLMCYPSYWRHALIPRERPQGSRVKRGDPDYRPSSSR